MRTTGGGVPRVAVLASTAFGVVTVIANYLFPDEVFTALLATSGAVALLVYLVIAVSQLRLRRRLEQEGTAMPIRMWCYPGLTRAVVVVVPVMLVYMATDPDQQLNIVATGAIAVVVLAPAFVTTRNRRRDLTGS